MLYQKSPIFYQKSPILKRRNPIYVSQEPCIVAKEPYTLPKEPYILSEEPYIEAKEPYIRITRALYCSKRNSVLVVWCSFGQFLVQFLLAMLLFLSSGATVLYFCGRHRVWKEPYSLAKKRAPFSGKKELCSFKEPYCLDRRATYQKYPLCTRWCTFAVKVQYLVLHMCIHTNIFVCIHVQYLVHKTQDMGWLWLVGSIKLKVSFAKEAFKRDDILQKRPIILLTPLTVATS